MDVFLTGRNVPGSRIDPEISAGTLLLIAEPRELAQNETLDSNGSEISPSGKRGAHKTEVLKLFRQRTPFTLLKIIQDFKELLFMCCSC